MLQLLKRVFLFLSSTVLYIHRRGAKSKHLILTPTFRRLSRSPHFCREDGCFTVYRSHLALSIGGSVVDPEQFDADPDPTFYTDPGLGIRSFAHRSFAQMAQIKWVTVSNSLRSLRTTDANVSKSLRSLMTKEQPCANPFGCSWQKSNRERFAPVAHDKRANKQIQIQGGKH